MIEATLEQLVRLAGPITIEFDDTGRKPTGWHVMSGPTGMNAYSPYNMEDALIRLQERLMSDGINPLRDAQYDRLIAEEGMV